jgi:hypothetical protein
MSNPPNKNAAVEFRIENKKRLLNARSLLVVSDETATNRVRAYKVSNLYFCVYLSVCFNFHEVI